MSTASMKSASYRPRSDSVPWAVGAGRNCSTGSTQVARRDRRPSMTTKRLRILTDQNSDNRLHLTPQAMHLLAQLLLKIAGREVAKERDIEKRKRQPAPPGGPDC